MISRLMIDQIRSLRNSGFPIKKIAQSLGISRNTVRRYIRQNNQRDKREAEPAAPKIHERPGAWQEGLDWEKLVKERRSGVSAQQLYKEHDPAISYSRFCRVLREKSAPPPKPAIPLDHVAGQRAQVDYADGVKIIDPATGQAKKSQLFCGVLPFSSLTFAEFAPSQKLDSFIRSHERMWAYFGGVTPYLVVDNLKSGVKKAHRYDPEVNPTYCDYANKTGVTARPLRPGATQKLNRLYTTEKIKEPGLSSFLHKRQILLSMGKTGVGKTHLAMAVGNQLCQSGISTAYYSTNLFFEEVLAEEASGRYLKLLKKLAGVKVLILDDFAL